MFLVFGSFAQEMFQYDYGNYKIIEIEFENEPSLYYLVAYNENGLLEGLDKSYDIPIPLNLRWRGMTDFSGWTEITNYLVDEFGFVAFTYLYEGLLYLRYYKKEGRYFYGGYIELGEM